MSSFRTSDQIRYGTFQKSSNTHKSIEILIKSMEMQYFLDLIPCKIRLRMISNLRYW